MKLWTHQKLDLPNLRDKSVIRIHRVVILGLVWIWSRQIKPPEPELRLCDTEIWEQAYIDRHPEIWPREPVKTRRKRRANTNNGGTSGGAFA